jgi:hypothetical protein
VAESGIPFHVFKPLLSEARKKRLACATGSSMTRDDKQDFNRFDVFDAVLGLPNEFKISIKAFRKLPYEFQREMKARHTETRSE